MAYKIMLDAGHGGNSLRKYGVYRTGGRAYLSIDREYERKFGQ